MKKIIAIIIALCLLLAGCASPPKYESKKSEQENIMRILEVSGAYNVFIDSENGVMYLAITYGYGTAVTVMYEPDGSIKTHPDHKN